MTIKEMYIKAMILLGYVKSDGEIAGQQELQKQSVAAVNQIYADLFFYLEIVILSRLIIRPKGLTCLSAF